MGALSSLVFFALLSGTLRAAWSQEGTTTWLLGGAPGCGNVHTVAVDAGGTVVAYAQCVTDLQSPNKPTIHLVDVDGTRAHKVSTAGYNLVTNLRVSNGGERIAYISGFSTYGTYVWNDVYIVDGATGVTTSLTGPPGGHGVGAMDMSADGSKIVYGYGNVDPASLGTYVWTVGVGAMKISDFIGENCISGDGSTVAITVGDQNQTTVYVMSSDGTNVRSIHTPEEHDSGPWLNHDGSELTLVSYFHASQSTYRWYHAKSDGSQVTVLQDSAMSAQISGNGEWVLLATIPPGGTGSSDPTRIHPDGSGKQIFFPCGVWYQHRRISHDGSVVALTCATEPGVTAGLHVADWNLPNLKLVGVPKVGTPISLVLNGTSGEPFVWFLSLGTASITVPPYGTFGIDPSTLSVLTSGVLDSNGKYTLGATLPTDPILVGAHAYLQAVSGATPLVLGGKLTNALDLAIEG